MGQENIISKKYSYPLNQAFTFKSLEKVKTKKVEDYFETGYSGNQKFTEQISAITFTPDFYNQEGYLLTLTHDQVQEAFDAFTKSGFRTLLFLRECLPHLVYKSTSSQYKFLSHFCEISYKKGEVIVKRQDKIPENPFVYLICKGEVRLEVENNPATKIQQELEFGVDAFRVEKLHNTASGFGSISRTIHRSQVTTLNAQQWLGEEVPFADMPLIYDAIAHSDTVKVLKISTSALVTNIDELDVEHI